MTAGTFSVVMMIFCALGGLLVVFSYVFQSLTELELKIGLLENQHNILEDRIATLEDRLNMLESQVELKNNPELD